MSRNLPEAHMLDEIRRVLTAVSQKDMSKQQGMSLLRKLHRNGEIPREDSAVERARAVRHRQTFSYAQPYLRDHRVRGERVLLGVTHCSLAVEAYRVCYPGTSVGAVRNLLFLQPVALSEGQSAEVTVSCTPAANTMESTHRYEISPGGQIGDTAAGKFKPPDDKSLIRKNIDLSFMYEDSDDALSKQEVYRLVENTEIAYGPSLRTIDKIQYIKGEAWSLLTLTDEITQTMPSYFLHPALLDGAIVSGALNIARDYSDPFIPFMIKEVLFYAALPSCVICNAKLIKQNTELFELDLHLYDSSGTLLASLTGLCCKRMRIAENQVVNDTPSEINADESCDQNTPSTTPCQTVEQGIARYLQECVGGLIGIDPITVDRRINFMDHGADSNQLLSLAQEIEKQVGIELYPTLFFEYQNIDELVDYFCETHADEFSLFLRIGTDSASSKPVHVEPKVIEPKTPPVPEELSKGQPTKNNTDPDIAIIGMAGRFAKSDDLKQFWDNILSQTDVIREIPLDHFDYRFWFCEETGVKDKMYCKWGSFIDEVGSFDAGFFRITPREAMYMDPQLRLLLETMYHTAENAGVINNLRGKKVGNYVGACFHDYMSELSRSNRKIGPYDGTGNAASMLANRPSFFFDLKGPSLTIDTACSSSLTALHEAVAAMRRNECEMAFVSGVNLLLSSVHYRHFCSIGALSPTGRCHTFSTEADGYVPGEGIASVLIKPLSKAIADGDLIHGIIKGTAVNHGGYTPSVTAPSVKMEAQVIKDAWQDARIDPATLSYIEAHGTGTDLGDPIEINGLKLAFKDYTDKTAFCAVGSLKEQYGHTEGAAGIAGVIKVLLSMKAKTLPAMASFTALNNKIKLEGSPLYINTSVQAWKESPSHQRRAGVSSFGFGGAYAHVVLEDYEPMAIANNGALAKPQLFLLSAMTEETLKRYASRYVSFLEFVIVNGEDVFAVLATMAYTLQVKREAMDHRIAIVASGLQEIKEQLDAVVRVEPTSAQLFSGTRQQGNTQAGSTQIETLVLQRDLLALAKLWTQGIAIDFSGLHSQRQQAQLALPQYPFSKKLYWMPTHEPEATISADISNGLHPLVAENISDLWKQKFKTIFTGDEFFLSDHQVEGQRILPGVAYLEMVRAAAELSLGRPVACIEDVVWIKPAIVINGCLETIIEIQEESGHLAFNVKTACDAAPCSQGRILYTDASVTESVAPPLDLPAIRDRCTRVADGRETYNAFNNAGLTIGERFQTIRRISSNNKEALSELALSDNINATRKAFKLHPALVDGAVQSMGAVLSNRQSSLRFTYVPFSVARVEIFDIFPERCYGYAKLRIDKTHAEDMHYFDIYVVDEEGVLLLKMSEFLIRAFEDNTIREMADNRQTEDIIQNVRVMSDEQLESLMLELTSADER